MLDSDEELRKVSFQFKLNLGMLKDFFLIKHKRKFLLLLLLIVTTLASLTIISLLRKNVSHQIFTLLRLVQWPKKNINSKLETVPFFSSIGEIFFNKLQEIFNSQKISQIFWNFAQGSSDRL